MENSSSNSEGIGQEKCSSNRNLISDSTVFMYCLAGTNERVVMLKEVATTGSTEQLEELGHRVSLYTGCSHHSHQISMTKSLVEQGTNLWNSISQKNNLISWENVKYEIGKTFMNIARCTTRSLTEHDFELLRKLAGCQELMSQEHFEKMWCWLYPVSLTLSQDLINPLWNSNSPKWIQGFCTKEEVDFSLRGPGGFEEPGTFLLRFPTSRSWPHPDAGSLIVTYVGSDYMIYDRLLILDSFHNSDEAKMDTKSLQDMLLAQSELSHLGRIVRSH